MRKEINTGIVAKERARQLIAGAFGLLLGLTVVKFGNPVILDQLVPEPRTGLELVFSTWPSKWAFKFLFGQYFVFGLLFAATVLAVFGSTAAASWQLLRRRWQVTLATGLLIGWYAWQWTAAQDTVSTSLTQAVLAQFTVCLLCFCFGLLCLRHVPNPSLFWAGLTAGMLVVLWTALEQKFGGLEAARNMIYEQGNLEQYPEEFLQRLSKGRVFGTLFYPNALAGVILLLAPGILMAVHHATYRFGNIPWGLAVGLLTYLCTASLYWSGSKSGWLIAAAMVLAVILRLPMARPKKGLVLICVALLAVGAFGIRYAQYFQQGATSVVARFDYWRAALQIAAGHPLTGTGPGTFQIPYARLKPPDAEMARLVHNDYLQQACDSGFPGFIFYFGFLASALVAMGRRPQMSWSQFAVCLGLSAWALHSCVEFGLYIPAIAWPAFTMLGWQMANGMDTETTRH